MVFQNVSSWSQTSVLSMVTNFRVTNVLVTKKWSQKSRSQTSGSKTSGNRKNPWKQWGGERGLCVPFEIFPFLSNHNSWSVGVWMEWISSLAGYPAFSVSCIQRNIKFSTWTGRVSGNLPSTQAWYPDNLIFSQPIGYRKTLCKYFIIISNFIMEIIYWFYWKILLF